MNNKFLPPVLVGELEDLSLRAVKNNHRKITFLFLMLALFYCLIGIYFSRGSEFFTGLGFVLLAAAMYGDYKFGLSERQGVAERTLFFWWLKNNNAAKNSMFFWLFFCVLMGGCQALLQYEIGLNEVFFRFGLMYDDVEQGQYWRLISGPYLHYSLVHFFSNCALLVFAGWMLSSNFNLLFVLFAFLIGFLFLHLLNFCLAAGLLIILAEFLVVFMRCLEFSFFILFSSDHIFPGGFVFF